MTCYHVRPRYTTLEQGAAVLSALAALPHDCPCVLPDSLYRLMVRDASLRCLLAANWRGDA